VRGSRVALLRKVTSGVIAMRARRWFLALAAIAGFGVLVASASRQSPVGTWLVLGAWGVLIGAMVARGLRSSARGHRLRSGAGPAINGLDEVQGLYLGRPDVGPVSYGQDGPPQTQLTVDRAEPDPGDLRSQAGTDAAADAVAASIARTKR
jgi:hypothetical protein